MPKKPQAKGETPRGKASEACHGIMQKPRNLNPWKNQRVPRCTRSAGNHSYRECSGKSLYDQAKRQISAGIAARKEGRRKKESAGTLLRMKHQNSNLRIHLQSAGPARCTVRIHSTI